MKIAIAGLLLGLTLLVPAPTVAKVPWSSVEVEPGAPEADEAVSIAIRFWDDAEHSLPTVS